MITTVLRVQPYQGTISFYKSFADTHFQNITNIITEPQAEDCKQTEIKDGVPETQCISHCGILMHLQHFALYVLEKVAILLIATNQS